MKRIQQGAQRKEKSSLFDTILFHSSNIAFNFLLARHKQKAASETTKEGKAKNVRNCVKKVNWQGKDFSSARRTERKRRKSLRSWCGEDGSVQQQKAAFFISFACICVAFLCYEVFNYEPSIDGLSQSSMTQIRLLKDSEAAFIFASAFSVSGPFSYLHYRRFCNSKTSGGKI